MIDNESCENEHSFTHTHTAFVVYYATSSIKFPTVRHSLSGTESLSTINRDRLTVADCWCRWIEVEGNTGGTLSSTTPELTAYKHQHECHVTSIDTYIMLNCSINSVQVINNAAADTSQTHRYNSTGSQWNLHTKLTTVQMWRNTEYFEQENTIQNDNFVGKVGREIAQTDVK